MGCCGHILPRVHTGEEHLTLPSTSDFIPSIYGWKMLDSACIGKISGFVHSLLLVLATRSYADLDLYNASRDGDLEAVRRILSVGLPNVNCRVDGRTPMMVAAWNRHSDVVELLVKEDANVTLVDDHKNNVLHYACRGGDVETVKLVMSLNIVDVNSHGCKSKTPVIEAAQHGHRDVVELLVKKGADVTQVDDIADVSLVDGVKDNILHYACRGGDKQTVKLVLSLNIVDINSRGQNSLTPVIVAAQGKHRDIYELLVTEGDDVSLVDDSRTNILHWACLAGDLGTVKLVLSLHAADINARSDYGNTTLEIARFWGHPQWVDLLVSSGTQ
ncbi:receptor-interacting serine/threonine-protein kinase 4-like [Haliotis asinina]|uniref:receptor-interacting serine/threonine-protein kinase 4-like n=1 Tax=Haliotis asinina TaxID=109174 RepID=UPI0035322BE1